MPTPKPSLSPTSNLTRHIGAKIADHVRDDVLAELQSVIAELLLRGCSDIGIHIFDGHQISDIANRRPSSERGVIPVGGIGARCPWTKRDGTDRVSLMVHWYCEQDLVGADWRVLEGGEAST